MTASKNNKLLEMPCHSTSGPTVSHGVCLRVE